MKKITLFFTLLAIQLGFSQIAPIDFEPGGNGASWTWATFQPPPGETVDFVVAANPSTTGINGSANVGKIDISFASTENWGEAGVESNHGADIGTFTITASNSYVTMQVYQEGFTAPVALKFANAAGGALFEVTSTFPITTPGVWQEVTFDISAWVGNVNNPVDQIIFFPSYAPRATGHVVYFDNVSFGALPAPTCTDGIMNGNETGIDCGGSCPDVCPPPPAPMASAPIPTPVVEDVLYIYSDAYSNATYQVELVNTSAWATVGPSAYNFPSTDYTIPSVIPTDNVRQFDDLNNAFIQFATTDATNYKYFHIDVWSANATFFRVNLQDLTAAVEGSEIFPLTMNQWNSIEIDLDSFGGVANDRDALFQFIIFGDPVGVADVFVDNIYFSKTSTLGTDDFAINSFKTYPNPTQDNWTIETQNIRISSITVYDVLGKRVMAMEVEADKAVIDGSSLKSGLYFAQVETEEGTSSVKLIKN